MAFVQDECSPNHIGNTKDRHFTNNPWAEGNTTAAVCVQHIAAYAVDQCVMITRRQNVVAADVNLALGTVTLGASGAALYYAIKGPTEKDTEGLIASAATASNTSRGFLPANTSVKVSDLLGGALPYAEAVGVVNDDIKDALSYIPEDQHGRRLSSEIASTMNSAERKNTDEADSAIVKLARVHDAVFAGCAANAYGLKPSAKPYK